MWDVESTAHPAFVRGVGYDARDAWVNGVLQSIVTKIESNRVNGPDAEGPHAFIYDMKHKTTGKEAKGWRDYFEWGFDAAGLCVYGKCYWGNPGAVGRDDAGGGRLSRRHDALRRPRRRPRRRRRRRARRRAHR